MPSMLNTLKDVAAEQFIFETIWSGFGSGMIQEFKSQKLQARMQI